MKPKVIVIVGPTAVGKTKLSIDIAKLFNCEIISADSMQIYKGMDIGTAKPSLEERQGIKHYLIDEVDPSQEFSVAHYKELAEKYIEEIINRGKTPLIVGGTGLYINSLIYNINYSEVTSDPEYRKELSEVAEINGNEYLHEMLRNIDPETAAKLHPNDTGRIIRALEVYKCTNKPISYHKSISRLKETKYDYILIGLNMERAKLYDRINKRVEIMIDNGLLDEVKNLMGLGFDQSMTSMKGIGYKELMNFLEAKCTLSEAIDIIKQESRRYAKRQLTWFRRNNEIKWFEVSDLHYEIILKIIREYIEQKLAIM